MAAPPEHIDKIAAALRRRYRDHDHDHYNRRNPLDELLFIICSTQTTETSYRRTFRDLRREFPTVAHLTHFSTWMLTRCGTVLPSSIAYPSALLLR